MGVGGSVFGPVTKNLEYPDEGLDYPGATDVSYADGTAYDINICHMRRFEFKEWVLKDMFMEDVKEATA